MRSGFVVSIPPLNVASVSQRMILIDDDAEVVVAPFVSMATALKARDPGAGKASFAVSIEPIHVEPLITKSWLRRTYVAALGLRTHSWTLATPAGSWTAVVTRAPRA